MVKTLALLLAAAPALAWAQDYPGKPVRMVVGFPPGGGTDVVARILAPKLSELLGQPLVIENRPGATGTAAAAMVAKSPPDGYTIMMGHVSVNAIAPSLFANLQYDAIRDFAPVALGDYAAGPNHTLPTSGAARFASPLGVHTFLKRTSVLSLNRGDLETLREASVRLAQMEGLGAHAHAIEVRLE